MSSPRIMIVEDESIIALDIQERLKGLGYSVPAVAYTGEEALDVIAQAAPDLVLMDIRLSGAMDGVETAKRIRDQHDIPVIYLTAYADDATLERAKETTPYGYLLKPFKQTELHASVEMALFKHAVERDLKESERRYRLLAENVTDAIWAMDENLSVVYASPSLARLLGHEEEGFDGQSILESVAPDYADAFAATLKHGLKGDMGGSPILQCEMVRKDLVTIWTETQLTFVPSDGSRAATVLGVTRDIGERKRIERQFLHAQKMEAVGRLAGGVAHDINNILTAIMGWATFAMNGLPPQSPVTPDINEILIASQRASNVVRQLLAFSRRQPTAPRLIDLGEIVTNVENMLRHLIGEDIDLIVEPLTTIGPVRADPTQIEQVLINLAVNARDAMPDGGQLVIGTSEEWIESQDPELRPGRYVNLCVRDTGCGMSSEIMDRIFEPFFTTKEPGKGTGLGLSVVFGIVKQNGGRIRVESTVGCGTVFEVLLPCADPEIERLAQDLDPSALPLPRGTETILLAEDDESIRRLAAKALRALGYKVLEASNGQEALHASERHPRELHLVVTDMVMPLMGGRELVQRLGEFRPDIKALFISGYPDSTSGLAGESDHAGRMLEKPFTGDTLALRVREVLDDTVRRAGHPSDDRRLEIAARRVAGAAGRGSEFRQIS